VEVSPRDGIQNIARQVSTEEKIELIRRAGAAGLSRIEVTSFVDPRRVPQMADAEAVVLGARQVTDARLSGLVLNTRGGRRAVEAGVDEVTFVLLASEAFNQRNQGMSRDRSLDEWASVAALCRAHGVPTTLMVGAAFGCPFEGEVDPDVVLGLLEIGLREGPDELALADTIGCGVPRQVTELFTTVTAMAPRTPTRAHFHNTRNTGYANAFAAVEAGVTSLDASLAGLGGCPFAPAATGNIGTEDLTWMLSRSKIGCEGNLERMIETVRWMAGIGL
jgi:hydroxymethylglutaryl-CoA lyase